MKPKLEGRHRADVCIVGGGYTGLSAALHLAEAGYSVILVEAHRAGWGASGRNGGQVGTGQRRDQDELESRLGRQTARQLWELAEESKALVADLIERFDIECEAAPGIIHADHKPRYVPHSRSYADKLNSEYGYEKIRFVDREEMRALIASEDYHGGTHDAGSFHVHPLKYVLGLARAAGEAGAQIFENSEVTAIRRGRPAVVTTAKGEVEADHVLLGCNGYLGGLEPEIAARAMPINNFIIATEPLGADGAKALISNNAAVADSRFVINYFRLTPDHRLLFGGGENYGYRFPADIKAFVRRPMLKVFPQLKDARIDYGWGGTLAVTADRLPLMIRLGDNILSASGYSGQGVTIATLAGKLAAEAIRGQAERFDVFSSIPHLAFPGGPALRPTLLALAMTWYALRDRL
jgi:gamma-glutamylputrescine oxidase